MFGRRVQKLEIDPINSQQQTLPGTARRIASPNDLGALRGLSGFIFPMKHFA
jgi:hypothetical protein